MRREILPNWRPASRGPGEFDSKENLNKGFLVLDISGSCDLRRRPIYGFRVVRNQGRALLCGREGGAAAQLSADKMECDLVRFHDF